MRSNNQLQKWCALTLAIGFNGLFLLTSMPNEIFLMGSWVQHGVMQTVKKLVYEELERIALQKSESHIQALNIELDALRFELDQMHTLMQMTAENKLKCTWAEVIQLQSESGLMSIKTKQEVQKYQAVVAMDGLVGRIMDAQGSYAVVQLLNAPKLFSELSVWIECDKGNGAIALLGSSAEAIVLSEDREIQKGASVFTSSFSNEIPKGIPIGTVSDVIKEGTDGTKIKIDFSASFSYDSCVCVVSGDES